MFRPLLGHLQGLWRNRSRSYLNFNAFWELKCLQNMLNECEIHRFIYKNRILPGRHVSTVIRSSLGPLGKQIQELSLFQCIVGTQMLTEYVI